MFNHAPENYACVFCRIATGDFSGEVLTTPDDIVVQTDDVTVLVASHWWENNPGHVIIIPNLHFENIYELPLGLATAIHAAARDIAIVMKHAYACDGVSTRQHNEPAGNQDIWHYHLHVFPRYHSDNLYTSARRQTTGQERAPFAHRLRDEMERS